MDVLFFLLPVAAVAAEYLMNPRRATGVSSASTR